VAEVNDEPPDENEQYENLDEALDDLDIPGHGPGPEGQRDVDSELVADRSALESAGAALDDPERISLLEGAMDDPNGSGPPEPNRTDSELLGTPDQGIDRFTPDEADEMEQPEGDDPELEIVPVDATELDQIPDDAPGPDSARW
jgi:hypothetical protein